jgi:hypothetical protein
MRPLALVVVLLLGASPLRADNWIENGDFSAGLDHWRGNGRSPADMAADSNPMDQPDPLLSKGLILPLRGVDWDKVMQDFHGKATRGVLKVVFQLAPDVAFSSKAGDYDDIPEQIHYPGWKPFSVPMGSFIVFIADLGSAHGTYYPIPAKLGVAGPQTVQASVSGLTPLEDKTITIAFPPGSGNVVLLNVSLTDQ